jgi:hypothetical protein
MALLGRSKLSRFLFIFFCTALSAMAHEPEAQTRFGHAHTHDALDKKMDIHIQTALESRYSLEGRDSLDGDAISATSLDLGWGRFTGGLWYGWSPDQNYEESRITLGLTEQVGDFEFYAGYTHLKFPDSHDNEVGVGGVWSGLPLQVDMALDAYYSFDADGAFWELSLSRAVEVSERLTFTGSGMFGINDGYIPDGHSGANHLGLRLGSEYILTESLTITGHATYSWALERNSRLAGDKQLADFFHGGLGLEWSF